MTTRASPRRIRHHSSCRSPADSPEWRTASSSPSADAQPVGDLRDQAHLRDEHDRRPARVQRLLDRGEVHIGLARCGDALEQELAARGECPDRVEGGTLLVGASSFRSGTPRARCASGSRSTVRHPSSTRPNASSRRAGREEARRIHLERFGQVRHRRLAVAERLEDRALNRCATRRLGVRRAGRGRRGRDARRPLEVAGTTRRGSPRTDAAARARRCGRGAGRAAAGWRRRSSPPRRRADGARPGARPRPRRPTCGRAVTRGRAAASRRAWSRSALGSTTRCPRPARAGRASASVRRRSPRPSSVPPPRRRCRPAAGSRGRGADRRGRGAAIPGKPRRARTAGGS